MIARSRPSSSAKWLGYNILRIANGDQSTLLINGLPPNGNTITPVAPNQRIAGSR
jgi:hypothetical protein